MMNTFDPVFCMLMGLKTWPENVPANDNEIASALTPHTEAAGASSSLTIAHREEVTKGRGRGMLPCVKRSRPLFRLGQMMRWWRWIYRD